jgi:hypothetical protein
MAGRLHVVRGSTPRIEKSSALNPSADKTDHDLARAGPSVTRSGIPQVRRLERD